jgi:hypothetical protein
MESIFPALNVPTRLERGEITESLLVPLMNQFGQMQQQMLDQFQQAISMIVQMFGTLHQDQMATIREELDQLRDLTREFHALKLELAARSQGQTHVVLTSTSTDRVDSRMAGAISGVREEIESRPATQQTPAAARIVAKTASVSSIPPVEDGSRVTSSTQAPRGHSTFEHHEAIPPQPQLGVPNVESERDVMVWLHQRMMVLQEERESRWRKILKLLPGLS